MEGSLGMAGEQRKCANCRYFQDAGVAKNGWCTHPKRQTTSDVKLLVRAGELACRNPWGGDLFETRHGDQQSPEDSAPDAVASQPSADDEVTSVVTPPDRFTAPHRNDEDRVVSDRPAPMRDRDDDDTYNDAARLDQDERARVMARGNRDAIMRARERHSSRRNPAGTPERDADLPASHDRVVEHQARFTDRDASSSSRHIDDAPVPRSEVRNRFGIPADRFDTVPDIDPSFDLPGYMSDADHTDEPGPAEAELPEILAEATETREHSPAEEGGEPFEHVVQRARRIRQAKMQKAANPLRHSHLLARHQSRTRTTELVAPREDAPAPYAADYDADLASDAQEAMDEPRFSAPLVADESWADERVDDTEAPNHEDADIALMADDASDEWEESIEDAPAERSGRRTGGWLSHFGLRRRTGSMHDDAQITRHSTGWDEDEAFDEQLPDDWNRPARAPDRSSTDRGVDRREPQHPEPQRARYVGQMDDDQDVDAFDEPIDAPDTFTSGYYSPSDVAYDNMDPGSRRRADLLPDLYDDDASVEPVTSAPVERPRAESWHRQRLAHAELPDLDDNLFEETFDRPRPSSPADALDRAPAPEPAPVPNAEVSAALTEQDTVWPRESYFRASRYRTNDVDSETQGTGSVAKAALDAPRRLPDLDAGGFDLRELVTRGGELLDMTIDIAPEIPRECRTCRSFRSADGGARGWCTNEWAFTHRRMVNEDDLACETTIGCWWLPADRYWLIEEQDGFAAPTPRIDQLIAQRSQPAEKKISGA
jgi:hypothetical protein